MCGLVGVAGSIDKQDVAVFNDLLMANVVRGRHNTGVAGVPRVSKKDTEVIKCIGGPLELMDLKAYERVVDTSKKVLIGHNRYATVGGISRATAHPFDFEHLVGAHNGTIDRWRLEDYNEFPTDSEALYHNMNMFGPDAAIGKIGGAWALTWYDKVYNTINLLRNKERPLVYAFTDEGRNLWWASEAGMLRWCLWRNQLEPDEGKIWDVTIDNLLTWEVPDYGRPFRKAERTEVKGYGHAVSSNVVSIKDKRASAQKEEEGGSELSKLPFLQQQVPEPLRGKDLKTTTGLTSPLNSSTTSSAEQSKLEKGKLSKKSNASGAQSTDIKGKQEKQSEAEAGVGTWNGAGVRLGRVKTFEIGRGSVSYRCEDTRRLITPNLFDELTRKGCSWCAHQPEYGDRIKCFGIDDFLCEECTKNDEVNLLSVN